MAAAALPLRERDAVRAAVSLLSTLVAPGEKALMSPTWQQGRAAVEAYMSASGEPLVAALLLVGPDRYRYCSPRHRMPLDAIDEGSERASNCG